MPDDSIPAPRSPSFLHNVIWLWSGVLFTTISGIFLSPYVIHHLGSEGYGIWALVFSLVDYYALVDFGFRSAILKYAAHYRATGDQERMEILISTGLLYFTAAAAVVVGVSLLFAWKIDWIFKISPGSVGAMRFLVVTVGVGFALGVVFSACGAVLEAYQRFDITSRVQIVTAGIRVIGCFAVLFIGQGLKSMGIVILTAQLTSYSLQWRAMRQMLPGQRFSPARASFTELKTMMHYGVRSFSANMSLHMLNQAPPLVLGHFVSAAAAGYYIYPRRLLSLSADLVFRVGMITGSKAAELTALGDLKAMARMTVLVNRYCLMLFLPLSVYLSIFGRQLLGVWIDPEFAANSAPLLPVLGTAVAISIAASHSCSAVLYGLAKHGALAKSLLVEASLCVPSLWYLIPRHGILAGAYVVAGLMIASRGIYVPYVVCRHIELNFFKYLWGVYGRPVLTMSPVAAAVWMLNRHLGAPATWTVVLGGGAALLSCYYSLSLLGLESGHRRQVFDAAVGFVFRRRAGARA